MSTLIIPDTKFIIIKMLVDIAFITIALIIVGFLIREKFFKKNEKAKEKAD